MEKDLVMEMADMVDIKVATEDKVVDMEDKEVKVELLLVVMDSVKDLLIKKYNNNKEC